MAIITDPDSLTRFSVVFGTISQEVSIYPVSTTQRNSGVTYVNTFIDSPGTIRATDGGDFGTDGVVQGDVLALLDTSGAGHYYVYGEYSTGTIIFLTDIDNGDPAVSGWATNGNSQVVTMDNTSASSTTLSTSASADHGITTIGTPVVFPTDTGLPAELSAGTVYYVRTISPQNTSDIEFYTTYDLAVAGGGGISLSAGSGTDIMVVGSQKLVPSNVTFADTAVATNIITASSHGLVSGDAVVFDDLADGTPVTGITAGTQYYAIWLSANTFSLATTYTNAIAGTATTVTAGTGGEDQILRLRAMCGVFDNGANNSSVTTTPTGEFINTFETSGDALGVIKDGITMQAVYSFGKEEWRVDSLLTDETNDWNDDTIRTEFPFEAITSEQFEVGGGAAHDAWTWFNDYTRKKVRTGGWAEKNNADTDDLAKWTGIVTLGALDNDAQVYYQQVSTTTTKADFTFTGVVNEALQVQYDPLQDTTYTGGFNRLTYLKLFVRKKGRTYAGSDIDAIGVTTISTIVNRFPLTHVTDAAITITDARVLGTTPYRNQYELTNSVNSNVTLTDGATSSTLTFTSAGSDFTAIHLTGARVISAGTADFTDGTRTMTVAGTAGTGTAATFSLVVASSTVSVGQDGTILTGGDYSAVNSNTAAGLAATGAGGSDNATFAYTWNRVKIGDILYINDAGTTGDNGYYEITAVTTTTLTVREAETVSGNDFTFNTDWATGSLSSLDYQIFTTTLSTDLVTSNSATVANWTSTGTANGLVMVSGYEAEDSPTVKLATLNDPDNSPFAGVNAGDLVLIEGGTANTESQGVYKVVDSNTTGASDPTASKVFLDATDHAGSANLSGIFINDSGTGVDADIQYRVVEPGMYLEYLDKEVDAMAGVTDVFFDASTAGVTNTPSTITIIGDTWPATNTGFGQGSMIVVTDGDQVAPTTLVNAGRYTVLERLSDTQISVKETLTDEHAYATSSAAMANILSVREGFRRTGFTDTSSDTGSTNDTSFSFNWRVTGNNGELADVFRFIQYQLRLSSDIDYGGGTSVGNITDLLMSFATPTGTGLNLFIDDLNTGDINNATFQDHGGTDRNFPFTASGNLVFNSNLVGTPTSAGSDSKYWLFFTNDNAGTNLGRDYGTKDAIIVDDSNGTDIAGFVNGAGSTDTDHNGENATGHTNNSRFAGDGSVSIPFTFDYEGNTQRGAGSANSNAPVTLVAIGLTNAQFVVSTGTITRATGITISAVAALERNYLNA